MLGFEPPWVASPHASPDRRRGTILVPCPRKRNCKLRRHLRQNGLLRIQQAVPTTLEGAVLSLTAAIPPPRDEFEQQIQSALDRQLGLP